MPQFCSYPSPLPIPYRIFPQIPLEKFFGSAVYLFFSMSFQMINYMILCVKKKKMHDIIQLFLQYCCWSKSKFCTFTYFGKDIAAINFFLEIYFNDQGQKHSLNCLFLNVVINLNIFCY